MDLETMAFKVLYRNGGCLYGRGNWSLPSWNGELWLPAYPRFIDGPLKMCVHGLHCIIGVHRVKYWIENNTVVYVCRYNPEGILTAEDKSCVRGLQLLHPVYCCNWYPYPPGTVEGNIKERYALVQKQGWAALSPSALGMSR